MMRSKVTFTNGLTRRGSNSGSNSRNRADMNDVRMAPGGAAPSMTPDICRRVAAPPIEPFVPAC